VAAGVAHVSVKIIRAGQNPDLKSAAAMPRSGTSLGNNLRFSRKERPYLSAYHSGNCGTSTRRDGLPPCCPFFP
jgi:hypothetical protein